MKCERIAKETWFVLRDKTGVNMECGKGKGKGKAHPSTNLEGPDKELKYNRTLSLTSALDVVGGPTPRPGCFTPRKDPVPTV
jgi:hypothetical protein